MHDCGIRWNPERFGFQEWDFVVNAIDPDSIGIAVLLVCKQAKDYPVLQHRYDESYKSLL